MKKFLNNFRTFLFIMWQHGNRERILNKLWKKSVINTALCLVVFQLLFHDQNNISKVFQTFLISVFWAIYFTFSDEWFEYKKVWKFISTHIHFTSNITINQSIFPANVQNVELQFEQPIGMSLEVINANLTDEKDFILFHNVNSERELYECVTHYLYGIISQIQRMQKVTSFDLISEMSHENKKLKAHILINK